MSSSTISLIQSRIWLSYVAERMAPKKSKGCPLKESSISSMSVMLSPSSCASDSSSTSEIYVSSQHILCIPGHALKVSDHAA